MLQITIPPIESFDDRTQEFVVFKGQTLQLEHSLVSLRKWESKWCKPFLSKQEKTYEETLDYIKCMTITQNVNPEVYNFISSNDIEMIDEYIGAPMTATYISRGRGGKINREIITAEVIYYWMIALQIPFECQKWHLNSLLTLIEVCNIKNSPPKQRNGRQLATDYAALNAARKKLHNTKG